MFHDVRLYMTVKFIKPYHQVKHIVFKSCKIDLAVLKSASMNYKTCKYLYTVKYAYDKHAYNKYTDNEFTFIAK